MSTVCASCAGPNFTPAYGGCALIHIPRAGIDTRKLTLARRTLAIKRCQLAYASAKELRARGFDTTAAKVEASGRARLHAYPEVLSVTTN